jgi:hypothetical protein
MPGSPCAWIWSVSGPDSPCHDAAGQVQVKARARARRRHPPRPTRPGRAFKQELAQSLPTGSPHPLLVVNIRARKKVSPIDRLADLAAILGAKRRRRLGVGRGPGRRGRRGQGGGVRAGGQTMALGQGWHGLWVARSIEGSGAWGTAGQGRRAGLSYVRRQGFDLEADERPPLATEFDTDQMDRLAARAVFVRIGAVFELLQGLTLGGELHHLEFE